MKVLVIAIIFGMCVVAAYSRLSCSSHESCGACTSFVEDSCVWCSQAVITGRRCMSIAELSTRKFDCREEHRVYPIKEGSHSPPDITPANLHGGNDAIQFVPHKLNVKASPGKEVNFNMYFKPDKDFPIDVYYLMDHSYTMRPHTSLLKQEGEKLYKELKSFTNNVRFGIGTFIDKPALPYVNPSKHLAYSFRNHLSLTNKIENFLENLDKVLLTSGANYDDPEAGLDALMQAMTCEDELDWRKDARRIIILCTDGPYHSAGDGKMVGADVTNDMKCHLKNNSYDGQLTFDYPSVSQINKVAADGKFIIIFAATAGVRNDYIALAKEIYEAQYAELKSSSNMVAIIREAYLKSIRVMKLRSDPSWPSNVKLSLDPDCLITEDCKIIHNTTLRIQAKLTVTSCDGPRNPVLNIGPSDLHESLKITLNVLCECECEKNQKNNSKECSYNGSYLCGVCKCNKGRSGSSCQCSGENTSSISESLKCKANETDLHFCSSHGICNCGKCDCDDGFSGSYCEFNNKACIRANNQLCGGHGQCHLGRCHCFQNWKGDDCTCSADTSGCLNPYTKTICSGKGSCVCGECVCEKDSSQEDSFGGAFCDNCQECAKGRCTELEPLLLCYWSKRNSNKDSCNKDFNTLIDVVNKTEINAKTRTGEWCEKVLENGIIVFRHYYDNNDRKLHVVLQDQLEPPRKADVWVPVGATIGTVLLIGILTLVIWKILVDHYDKKEYDNFVENARKSGYETHINECYVEPSSQFTNPTFEN